MGADYRTGCDVKSPRVRDRAERDITKDRDHWRDGGDRLEALRSSSLASPDNHRHDLDEEKIMPEQMNAELKRKLQELSRHNAVARALVFLWNSGTLTYEDWSTKAISLLIDQNEALSAIAVDAEKRACRLPKNPPVASPTR
ncbi:hypothetical protein XH84_30765 [Bradyrhizobium nanningense]|nr:hypothetical protein XH84_30765 [Bradyrhizobium nanningense]